MKAQPKGGSKAGLKNKYNAVKRSTNPKRPTSWASPAEAQKKKKRGK